MGIAGGWGGEERAITDQLTYFLGTAVKLRNSNTTLLFILRNKGPTESAADPGHCLLNKRGPHEQYFHLL